MTINGQGFSTRRSVQIRVSERAYQVIRELKAQERYDVPTAQLVDRIVMDWLATWNPGLHAAYKQGDGYDASS